MEYLELVIAMLSLILSIIALFTATKASNTANRISSGQLDLANGTLELEMRNSLNDASHNISELSLSIIPLQEKRNASKLTAAEARQLDALEKSFTAATQSWLNIYEDLSAKYLDGKVDRVRFKKNFNVEIRNLVERQSLASYFNPVSSRYKAILKVYDEWENLEK